MKPVQFASVFAMLVFAHTSVGQDDGVRATRSQPPPQSPSHSASGKLRAEFVKLYGDDGPRSLIKISTVKEKRLLHTFRVPGTVHAAAFNHDDSTVVTADGVGNLEWVSTIRAWDLATGKQRKLGSCTGGVSQFYFSPDGSRLAATLNLNAFGLLAMQKENGGLWCGQIIVWPLTDESEPLTMDFHLPRELASEIEAQPQSDDRPAAIGLLRLVRTQTEKSYRRI